LDAPPHRAAVSASDYVPDDVIFDERRQRLDRSALHPPSGGRIDFATRLNSDAADADQPNEFKLLVEERRIVESIAGNENLEIQWRLATLREAKAVVTQYHKYLSENSLIKTVVETDVSVAPGDFTPLEKQ
jgi:hypothetical protein